MRRDLTGQRFGRLTAIRWVGPSHWECECECGAITPARTVVLIRGNKRSCGCLAKDLRKQQATKHGMCGTREYDAWHTMIQRCNNPALKNYPNYGGRGIRVCERWTNGFAAFYEDMGDIPSAEHSLDRIDNNGNYEPSNCRWATRAEQDRNKRTNRYYDHDGRSMTLTEWSKELNVSPTSLKARLRKGMTIGEVISEPIGPYRPFTLEYQGRTLSAREWSEITGIPTRMIRTRVRGLGWSAEKALTTPPEYRRPITPKG